VDANATSQALMKLAAGIDLAEGVGKAIAATSRGVRKGYHYAGSVGERVAKGMGAGSTGQTVGSALGKGAVVGTGALGAKKGKRKVDEFRYRHGLYSQQGY
jgi:hypothetical protein